MRTHIDKFGTEFATIKENTNDMKKNDTYKICRIYSPSVAPKVIDVKDIIVVTMTCGGGMGGSHWKEYFNAVDIDTIPTDKIVSYTDAITGKKKAINTRYLVNVEEKQMLKVYDDITGWKNYHGKVCDKCFVERYLVLDRDERWECTEGQTGGNGEETVKTDIYEE